ncbi:relaxase domain-containing protein [Iamia sp. SCSIO 61187]|uniref:MobF family relaxase n=1 Tax=Iamia sp. SCSIO 61187 TaxID=2722752 RepID=UPI001C63593F|nr:MobF family relaxase [Iamia sp. SCSIO 61187]QYG91771.1 relaxase domain-containing protein [Iamia sp. SCSIO 61187]
MKFTVTPLGGGRADTARVVDSIVRYLQPPGTKGNPAPGTAAGGTSGPERYYADAGEEPGRWLGRSSAAAGLAGAVARDDFASVLAGRDPHTGERLITAQGSAGRRPTLGSGNHSRLGPGNEPLFDVADAAAVLDVAQREVERLLDAGTRRAVTTLFGASTASAPTPPAGYPAGYPVEGLQPPLTSTDAEEPQASFLVPFVDADGSRWVTEAELSRCRLAREEGVTPDAIRSLGAPQDQLSISEAARLAGVTAQYLRGVARYHEDHSDEIDQAVAAGRQPRHAYLEAHRGTKNRWLVTRERLAEFLERRRPPAVRVAYDLTLTTEKSLGVLALLGEAATREAVLGSIQAGNDWALGWLEDRAVGRIDGEPVPAEGLMVASFRHLTSRALDPFPHHHNVVMNTVTAPDGSHRSLWSRCLYQNAHAASALATAEMRHHLAERLDIDWRPGRKSGWEIDGISPKVVSEFSKRRNEIDDALRELEAEIGRGAHPSEVEHIVLRTRPAKNHTPADDLVARWRERAAACGLTSDDIDRLSQPATQRDSQRATQRDVVFDLLADPDGICAGGSVFTRVDAITAIANLGVPDADGVAQPLLGGAVNRPGSGGGSGYWIPTPVGSACWAA